MARSLLISFNASSGHSVEKAMKAILAEREGFDYLRFSQPPVKSALAR